MPPLPRLNPQFPRLLTKPTCRFLHKHITPPPPPKPTPFVPDVASFLTLIGRSLSQHSSKIPSWSALFTLTSPQLRDLGIEPARTRRYLLGWREKFRNGEYGIGGDLQVVENGVGEVRVVEVPTKGIASGKRIIATATLSPGTRKMPYNGPWPLPKGQEPRHVKDIHIQGSHNLSGKGLELVKGTDGRVGRIRVREGLWEVRRERKIDGGERRKAEVRAKRKVAERKER
ncbi:MAG: hypothetical protein M1834_006275 [Cirrosporium novae-zelandiae]|nr:MAG: hypothetical protein M1834_006275 [Cirrosporium novae-zelandiae]